MSSSLACFRHALCALLMLAAVSRVAAEAALPLRARVMVTGCGDSADEETLNEQIRVELLAAGVLQVEVAGSSPPTPSDANDELATIRVAITACQGAHRSLALSIADRHSGKHTTRALEVTDLPDHGRGRVVALALLELLRAEWRTLSTDSEKPPSPQPPRESLPAPTVRVAMPREPPQEPPPEDRSRIEWLGVSRIYPETDSGDLATSLGYSKQFGSNTRMTFGGTAAGGGGDGSDMHLFQGAGRVAVSLVGRTRTIAIDVGTAWEAGWGQLRGTSGGRVGGFLAIGTLQAALRTAVAKGVEAMLVVQAGYVIAPLTRRVPLDDARERNVGIQGSVLGVGLGLAGLL